MIKTAFQAAMAALLTFPLAGQTVVEPRILSETLPSPGLMQIKLDMTSPHPIITGNAQFEFVSAFDGFEGVSLFSPNGDAFGVAILEGTTFTANIVSPLGSLGTQLDYPFLVVAANIRPGLAVGTQIPINFTSGLSLTAPDGTPYSIPAPKNGVLTIGGSVSVSNVIPGGGPLPAGFVVRLLGTGFNADTRVDVNDAAISNLQLISPNELRFTLDQATEMTGRRIRVRNRDNSEVVYYSYLRSVPIGASGLPLLAAAHPVFSSAVYTDASLLPGAAPTNGFIGVAVENPGLGGADVAFELFSPGGALLARSPLSMPAATRYVRSLGEVFNASIGTNASMRVTSSAPVHVLGLRGDMAAGVVTAFAANSAHPPASQLTATPSSLAFNFDTAGPVPPSQTVQVSSIGSSLAVTATSNVSWLSVNPTSGQTPVTLTASLNPAGLIGGNYAGAITLTAPGVNPLAVPVALTVTSPGTPGTAPKVSASPSGLHLVAQTSGNKGPATRSFKLRSSAPVAFSVSTDAPWLKATPIAGQTPDEITVTANPAGLAPGQYDGSVIAVPASGPLVTVAVQFTVRGK